MSKPHVKQAKSSRKPGGANAAAVEDLDAHTIEKQHPEMHADATPLSDNQGHAHSAAAHLNLGGDEHTKPAGNLRQGSHPGALREPPMVVQRVGKQHRG